MHRYDDEIFASGGHPMAPGSPPSRWFDAPPPGDGAKVVITDTDHYAPGKGDTLWAWKSFVRGHHPILMDFGIIDLAHHLDPSQGVPPYEAFEGARYAMGDTRRYAERMALVDMVPRGDLTSTGYALANPGREYLVLQPSETIDRVSVRLDRGAYVVEWYDIGTRETVDGGEVTAEADGNRELTSPFGAVPAVLYLRRLPHIGTEQDRRL